jgi:glyoxylase-like metal-dependent hydrolase (beta-lactamase superfamily II)
VASVERVADGVYRLGTGWVGWYICEADDSLTVVDCGFAGYFDQLPAALSELDQPFDSVAAVVLTHYHSDHVGSAERIRSETGATVFGPMGDAAGIRSGRVPRLPGFAASVWRPTMMRYLAHAVRNGGASLTPVKQVRAYEDGDVLDVPGALRAIHTPGHTGGHCSLVAEDAGVVFAGDALATMSLIGGPAGPQLMPFNEDRDRAQEALSRLETVPAKIVVVGHGRPFEGTPAQAIDEARRRF